MASEAEQPVVPMCNLTALPPGIREQVRAMLAAAMSDDPASLPMMAERLAATVQLEALRGVAATLQAAFREYAGKLRGILGDAPVSDVHAADVTDRADAATTEESAPIEPARKEPRRRRRSRIFQGQDAAGMRWPLPTTRLYRIIALLSDLRERSCVEIADEMNMYQYRVRQSLRAAERKMPQVIKTTTASGIDRFRLSTPMPMPMPMPRPSASAVPLPVNGLRELMREFMPTGVSAPTPAPGLDADPKAIEPAEREPRRQAQKPNSAQRIILSVMTGATAPMTSHDVLRALDWTARGFTRDQIMRAVNHLRSRGLIVTHHVDDSRRSYYVVNTQA